MIYLIDINIRYVIYLIAMKIRHAMITGLIIIVIISSMTNVTAFIAGQLGNDTEYKSSVRSGLASPWSVNQRMIWRASTSRIRSSSKEFNRKCSVVVIAVIFKEKPP
jgi:hypothetical protein